MHQSRKEQALQREGRKLYHADFKEALIMAAIDSGSEISEEPGARKPVSRGFTR